jgi:hypothetical protein
MNSKTIKNNKDYKKLLRYIKKNDYIKVVLVESNSACFYNPIESLIKLGLFGDITISDTIYALLHEYGHYLDRKRHYNLYKSVELGSYEHNTWPLRQELECRAWITGLDLLITVYGTNKDLINEYIDFARLWFATYRAYNISDLLYNLANKQGVNTL